MTGQLFTVERRLVFENGWTIDIHKEEDGSVWYQRWSPGVDRQGVFDELYRQPSEWFTEQINRYPHKIEMLENNETTR